MTTYKITYKTKEGSIIIIESFTLLHHLQKYFDLISRGEIDFTVEVIKL